MDVWSYARLPEPRYYTSSGCGFNGHRTVYGMAFDCIDKSVYVSLGPFIPLKRTDRRVNMQLIPDCPYMLDNLNRSPWKLPKVSNQGELWSAFYFKFSREIWCKTRRWVYVLYSLFYAMYVSKVPLDFLGIGIMEPAPLALKIIMIQEAQQLLRFVWESLPYSQRRTVARQGAIEDSIALHKEVRSRVLVALVLDFSFSVRTIVSSIDASNILSGQCIASFSCDQAHS